MTSWKNFTFAAATAGVIALGAQAVHAQVAPPPGPMEPTPPSVTLTGQEVQDILTATAQSDIMFKQQDGRWGPYYSPGSSTAARILGGKVQEAQRAIQRAAMDAARAKAAAEKRDAVTDPATKK